MSDKEKSKEDPSGAQHRNQQFPASGFQGSEAGGSEDDLLNAGRFNTANGSNRNMSQRAHSQKPANKFPVDNKEIPQADQ